MARDIAQRLRIFRLHHAVAGLQWSAVRQVNRGDRAILAHLLGAIDDTFVKIGCGRKAARSMKNYLKIRDSGVDDASEVGVGTFFGIDLRERNYARIRAA